MVVYELKTITTNDNLHFIGYFSDPKVAGAIGRAFGHLGEYTLETVEVFNTAKHFFVKHKDYNPLSYEGEENLDNLIADRAMLKLTDRELQVLGLKRIDD